MSHTTGGTLSLLRKAGEAAWAASPTPVPMAKVMAESWKGGTLPDAAVISANSAHMAIAEKPIKVARAIYFEPCSSCVDLVDRRC